jgi:hypothetical protein
LIVIYPLAAERLPRQARSSAKENARCGEEGGDQRDIVTDVFHDPILD